MVEIICAILSLIWLILSIFFTLFLAMQSDSESKTIANCFKELVEELFYDRNIFGIIVSSFVCILFIPTGIFIVLISVVYLIGKIICGIWHLGDKKN